MARSESLAQIHPAPLRPAVHAARPQAAERGPGNSFWGAANSATQSRGSRTIKSLDRHFAGYSGRAIQCGLIRSALGAFKGQRGSGLTRERLGVGEFAGAFQQTARAGFVPP